MLTHSKRELWITPTSPTRPLSPSCQATWTASNGPRASIGFPFSPAEGDFSPFHWLSRLHTQSKPSYSVVQWPWKKREPFFGKTILVGQPPKKGKIIGATEQLRRRILCPPLVQLFEPSWKERLIPPSSDGGILLTTNIPTPLVRRGSLLPPLRGKALWQNDPIVHGAKRPTAARKKRRPWPFLPKT